MPSPTNSSNEEGQVDAEDQLPQLIPIRRMTSEEYTQYTNEAGQICEAIYTTNEEILIDRSNEQNFLENQATNGEVNTEFNEQNSLANQALNVESNGQNFLESQASNGIVNVESNGQDYLTNQAKSANVNDLKKQLEEHEQKSSQLMGVFEQVMQSFMKNEKTKYELKLKIAEQVKILKNIDFLNDVVKNFNRLY